MLETNKKVIKKVNGLPATGDSNHFYYNTVDGKYYAWNSVTNAFEKITNDGNTTLPVYSKEYHVDPINGLDTNDGSDNFPFKTLAKANSVANNSGVQIVLHPGTYAESVTFAQQNLTIVSAQGTQGGEVFINGTITSNNTASSKRIYGVRIANLVKNGAGGLYLDHSAVTTTLDSNSGYLEVVNSDIQNATSSIDGGQATFSESKIGNTTVSNANTLLVVKNSDAFLTGGGIATITYNTGTIYSFDDVRGGNLVKNGTVLTLEQAALAGGASAATAKIYDTASFMKLAMLNPDTNASPTKFVTYNETTKRLEISNSPTGGSTVTVTNTKSGSKIADVNINGTAFPINETNTTLTNALTSNSTRERIGTYTNEAGAIVDMYASKGFDILTTTQSVPTATGNTTNLNTVFKGTDGAIYAVDANGDSIKLQGANDFCSTVFVNDLPASATIFSLDNPPLVNDDALKNLDCAIYVVVSADPLKDGQTWNSNGTVYDTYIVPPATEWNLAGTLVDAGSNKNGAIYRRGNVGISNFDNFVPVTPIDITTQGQVNATAYISVDGVNNGNQVVVNLGTRRGTGTFGNGSNKGWQIGARSDSWNQGGTQEANLMFLSFWNGVNFTQLAKFAPNGNVCLGASAYNFIPQFTLDVQGTARILTTPTITTATRMLVKDPTTGQVSEQNIPTGGSGSVESGQTDEFVATANQTTFTLTATPKGNVFAFRNGARLPKNAITISGTTATYVPANNDGNTLLVGNRITFDYIK
jgi:hypothetical protein